MVLANEFPLFSLVVLTSGQRSECLSACRASIERMEGRADAEVLEVALNGETVAQARNRGIASSRGKFVAFIAEDYELPVDYLRKMTSFVTANPHARVVSCVIKTNGGFFGRTAYDTYLDFSVREWFNSVQDASTQERKSFRIPASRAAAFRRDVFDEVGQFRADLAVSEDSEMAFRLSKKVIPVHVLGDCVVQHLELRTLRGLLQQRWKYGRAYLALRVQRGNSNHFSLVHVGLATFRRLHRWAGLSLTGGRAMRFAIELPVLVLLLGTFHLGIWFESRRTVRA